MTLTEFKDQYLANLEKFSAVCSRGGGNHRPERGRPRVLLFWREMCPVATYVRLSNLSWSCSVS